MTFLIDENLESGAFLDALTKQGLTVVTVKMLAGEGAMDETVFELARTRNWVVVTEDSDFNKLLLSTQASSPSVIWIRGEVEATEAAADIKRIAESRTDESTCFLAIISPRSVRIRNLPVDKTK